MKNQPSFFIDETDHHILMHKDVHFGGSFAAMLSYYEKEGIGSQEEFSLSRIEELSSMQESNESSLSDMILDDTEKKEVERAKEAYQSLQKLCDADSFAAQKLALLILSEEDTPLQEIDELCAFGKDAIAPLLYFLKQDDFYNPLFPGYGFAPAHAATCLGKLKAEEAIIPLFESLPFMEFFGEEEVYSALAKIGSPAKDFLLSVLKKNPITKDNENAAIALSCFPSGPEIVSVCLDMLELPSVQARPSLFSYLLCSCEGIDSVEQRERLSNLLNLPLPSEIKEALKLASKKNHN